MNLEDILTKYGVPDPSIVGKLPRGGITLDFVGHAEITRILLEIDPNWSWAPTAWDANGRPAVNEVNGMAVMWGYLTVLGQSRLGVGSARADKADLDKELVGDFLRNAAMRFGISLSLWSKSEWEEQGATPRRVETPSKPAPDFVTKFSEACAKKNLDPRQIAEAAGVNLDDLKADDAPKLRDAFKAIVNEQPIAKAVEDAESFIAQIQQVFPSADVIAETPKITDPDSPASKAQLGKVRAMLASKGLQSYTDKLDKVRDLLNLPDLNKLEFLTKGQASKVIQIIEEMK
jgi:hypothetical protein